MVCGWLIQQRYGAPITTDKRNRRRVNVAYWAAFIKELFDIRFHLTRGVFLALVPGLQARIVLERAKVFGLISCAYDSVLNRIYVGTSNSQYPHTAQPDELYGSGLLSLDAGTGQFRGFFQPKLGA